MLYNILRFLFTSSLRYWLSILLFKIMFFIYYVIIII